MSSIPDDINDASPEFLRALAKKVREQGLFAFIDMSLSDPDVVIDPRSGRAKNAKNMVKFNLELACQAFEMVADFYDDSKESWS